MRKLNLIAGDKGSGKSYDLVRELLKQNRRNALIIDVCDDPQFSSFQEIKPKEAIKFLSENNGRVAKVCLRMDDIGCLLKTINKIVDNCEGGILVLDSVEAYPNRDILNKIFEKIKTPNFCDQEIVLVFSYLHRIPKKIIKLADILKLHSRIHETTDFESVFSEFKIIKVANYLLKNKKKDNPYFNCSIVNRLSRIEGDFTKSEYRDACLDYFIEKEGLSPYFSKL